MKSQAILLFFLVALLYPTFAANQQYCPISYGGYDGGYVCNFKPAKVTYQGRQYVAVVGGGYATYIISQNSPNANSAWSGWVNLGGVATSPVGLYVSKSDILQLIVRGTDNRNWCRYFDGASWTSWFHC